MEKQEKIASFTVNHEKLLAGLYVSRKDFKNGVAVTTFDMRFTAPNREPPLDSLGSHTIEHLLATYFRNSELKSDTVYFGPMGCRTGFYLVLFGDRTPEEILPIVISACEFIENFNGEIPGATAKECGNYLEHNLNLAKLYAKRYRENLTNSPRTVYPE